MSIHFYFSNKVIKLVIFELKNIDNISFDENKNYKYQIMNQYGHYIKFKNSLDLMHYIESYIFSCVFNENFKFFTIKSTKFEFIKITKAQYLNIHYIDNKLLSLLHFLYYKIKYI